MSSVEQSNSGSDWTCEEIDCHHVNSGRRTQCSKCNRERTQSSSGSSLAKKKLGTEIGKAAAEKSRGLFSAEDWQCSKCANVNWARRQTCNMCNAPKFCDVEERTGYGGGYNDRGVVEYKDRSESDSEYDEFGRLKKRKKLDGGDVDVKKDKKKNNENDKNKEVDDEEEDEDEDDDGDGDLSKYDLWGDDEIATSASAGKSDANARKSNNSNSNESATKASTLTKKPNKKKSRSRSHSHSRSRSRSSSLSSSSSSSSTTSNSNSSSSSSTSSSSPHSRSSKHSQKKLSRSNSLLKGHSSSSHSCSPTPLQKIVEHDSHRSRSRSPHLRRSRSGSLSHVRNSISGSKYVRKH